MREPKLNKRALPTSRSNNSNQPDAAYETERERTIHSLGGVEDYGGARCIEISTGGVGIVLLLLQIEIVNLAAVRLSELWLLLIFTSRTPPLVCLT